MLQVHGTCLGFEALAIIISRNTSVLADMDALNSPAPLFYTELAATSDWLKALPPHVVTNLQNTPLAFENHGHGEAAASLTGCGDAGAFGALCDAAGLDTDGEKVVLGGAVEGVGKGVLVISDWLQAGGHTLPRPWQGMGAVNAGVLYRTCISTCIVLLTVIGSDDLGCPACCAVLCVQVC